MDGAHWLTVTTQIEKPDRIGLRIVALIVVLIWANITFQYWREALGGIVVGWVILVAVLWRLGRPDRERDRTKALAETEAADEARRRILLSRLATDMRAAAERKAATPGR